LPKTYAVSRSFRKTTDAAGTSAYAAIEAEILSEQRAEGPLADIVTPAPETNVATHFNEVGDDRDNIQPEDRVLLIIENDLGFARFLLDTARDRGFKGLVTSFGVEASALVHEYQPCAITLDIFLADIDGWRVLRRLKNDLATRHIPVYIISTEDARELAIRSGARDFVAKPIQNKQVLDELLDEMKAYLDRSPKRILVMDKKPAALKTITDYIEGMPDVEILTATDLEVAYKAINGSACDCVVLGENAADALLSVLTEETHQSPINANTPFIVLCDPETTVGVPRDDTIAKLPVARQVHSLERLLDQTTLALHQGMGDLTNHQRDVLTDIYQSNKAFSQRKVLIVDDDFRNIFALSSVLEDYDMKIVSAESGRGAIDILANQADIDIVLMDMMMPDLDGIDTLKEVRKMEACKHLPIVAVTAKAMKGDRERCLAAGAWDYLSKPVEREQLLGVLRAWLQR